MPTMKRRQAKTEGPKDEWISYTWTDEKGQTWSRSVTVAEDKAMSKRVYDKHYRDETAKNARRKVKHK